MVGAAIASTKRHRLVHSVQRVVLPQILILILLAFQIPKTLAMLLLEGKRILVTGSGRGIGRAIALICHQEGAQVAISSRTMSELDETAALAAEAQVAPLSNRSSSSITHNKSSAVAATTTCANTKMNIHVADVTKKEDVEAMVQEIVNNWGGIDILINNAGGAQQQKGSVDILEDEQALTSLLQLNVVSVHLVTNAVCRLAMKKDGRILNISSKAGKVGLENYSFYVASKFALEGMTASWSKELKHKNIIVNSLSPGMVNTRSFPKPPDKKGVRTPDSIRKCLLFALTSEMGYTGHYVHADEFDAVVREKGEAAASQAWKAIDELPFHI
ncbi:3-oxoacyl-ACP reductase [Nitzschia inconspicua]|uniref:3-oxoacyl-ACP reductase n=1 Tax=Nitzschia inconspicua TaxID=303405 RepID=A0A9K3LST3_9STRA|nr:3-oxoacyl-ACP reductase [Nitzschia inconspicua]